jgi:hypothetical protein
MSDQAPTGRADVTIGRLVLQLPGFNPNQAEALAAAVGDGLARAGISAERKSVQLALDSVQPDLAGQIVAALIQRLA